jgi:hypothetical protein
VHDRFGWERDNWLGRYRQENAWTADGYEFFAQRRLLRWLPDRRVRAALDERDRLALERLCARLPEVVPPRPACLTHGDLVGKQHPRHRRRLARVEPFRRKGSDPWRRVTAPSHWTSGVITPSF